jgi:hypothetical protein
MCLTGDVAGSHLEWFEYVIQEAEKDLTIRLIIVQAHLPILNPVRKVASSAMFSTPEERLVLSGN